MTITGPAPASYDPDFACCGGCSSSKRVDAYNNKLVTGARIFIWDSKIKTNLQPVCSLTFPYDPALNEQVGERRVRSGRRVGTNYPIDNVYDYLCCEQRGHCLALDEDASGKCQCIKRWGFTGDHCQYSVYDVAEVADAKVFPNATNFSSVDHMLPDLRKYLITFDYDAAISKATTLGSSPGSLMDTLETGSYRQFGWSTMAYFILAAAVFAFAFIFFVMWTFCFFKCGCRKRNPLAKPKIYGKCQKIVCGTLMTLTLIVSAAAALATLLVVHNDIEPLSAAAFKLLNKTLPGNLTAFETKFLSPIDDLLTKDYHPVSGAPLSLDTIQHRALADLEAHTFLDNQSYTEDVVGKPVFALLEPLRNYSMLFPTVNNDQIDCEKMNISAPNVTSRMTIGGTTGCFKCKACLTIVDLISEARIDWRMNIFEIQIDLITAKRDLKAFGQASNVLTPSIKRLLDRMRLMFSTFMTVNGQISTGYDEIAAEMQHISFFGLYKLCGLCGLAIFLSIGAFARGLRTGKRTLGRTTCFVAELAFLVALFITGVLYTMSGMVQDAIVVLQRLDADTKVFLPSAQLAYDVKTLLFDGNFVEATEMSKTLEFSDSLHVPPHPTPATDTPNRLNIPALYDMPSLFALENLTAHCDAALVELFTWDEDFLQTHYDQLKTLTFATSASPYNGTQHQLLLNSTIQRLMDPDNDGDPVTSNDEHEIQTVFNESWRGQNDGGFAYNEAIQTQWLVVAQLYYQKERLENYVGAISSIINKTHPLLEDLILKTEAMENAEYQLKAPVEFVTDSIRATKIADCHYSGNCAWFRTVLNDLFDIFQQMVIKAEHAVISCAISAFALLLAVLFSHAFSLRMRRNVAKMYVDG